ncbi:MAG: hypothetical protein ACOZAM_23740 [Pseudomonadota bacterium]
MSQTDTMPALTETENEDERIVLALYAAATRHPRSFMFYRHAADELRDLSFLAASGSTVGIRLDLARTTAKNALFEAERHDANKAKG